MIIDSHVHCFPDKIAKGAVKALSDESGLKNHILPVRDELILSMDRAGIDKSLVLPIATNPRQVVNCNNFAIELSKNERFLAFGTMHPDYSDIAGELKRIKTAGLRGIKLHPDFQGYFIDSGRMLEVMLSAAEKGLMIYLHCGWDISFPEVNRCTPVRVARVLPLLGDTAVICAHLGGYGSFDEAISYLAPTNVYVDTAAELGFFPDEKVKKAISRFGAERVLFGTDSPWLGQKECLEHLDRLGLNDNELELIKGKNAERLFVKG